MPLEVLKPDMQVLKDILTDPIDEFWKVKGVVLTQEMVFQYFANNSALILNARPTSGIGGSTLIGE